MSTDAELVAVHIRAAYARSMDEGLASPAHFVAEVVEVVQDPPHPTDGPHPGAKMAKRWLREGALLRSSMPDFSMSDLEVKVRGDQVALEGQTHHTASNGEAVINDFNVTYTVRDGCIVRASVRSASTTS
jgi:ketosteroid isomerase-like protein